MKSGKIQIGRKSLIKFSLIFLILSLILFFLFRFISIKAEAGISVIVSDPVIRGNLWSKKVVVSSDSEDHAYNISVSTNIPEDLTNVELYRYLTNDIKIKVTDDTTYSFQLKYTDNNDKSDTASWIIPELSEVSFSVEGIISYPEAIDVVETEEPEPKPGQPNTDECGNEKKADEAKAKTVWINSTH